MDLIAYEVDIKTKINKAKRPQYHALDIGQFFV